LDIIIFSQAVLEITMALDLPLNNIAKYGIIFVLVTILIVVIILSLVSIYILKEKHTVGLMIQKECDGIYFEKERGDYKVYEVYYSTIKNIYTAIYLLMMIVLTFYLFIIAIWTGIYLYKNNKIQIEFSRIFIFQLLIIVSIILIFIFWLISTAAYNKVNSKYEFTLSPFNTLISTWRILTNQILTLIYVLVIFAIIYFKESYITDDTLKQFLQLFLIFILVGVFILPSMSAFINSIEKVIKEYEIDFLKLKNIPEDIIKENEAIVNIDEFKEYGLKHDIPPQDKPLYAKHIEKLSDINFAVPEEIKPYILVSNLQGILLTSFKLKLIDYYIKRNKNTITNTNLTEFKDYLGDYLEPEILRIINTNTRSADETKQLNDFIEIINTHIITNRVFDKTDQVPLDMKDVLYKLRTNKNIENTINKYFNSIKTVIYFVIFIVLYYIYIQIAANYPDQGYTIWSIGVLVLLIIGFIISFLSKELWV
jgi:hypothetical protein